MFSMIVELVQTSVIVAGTNGKTYERMVFPDPAIRPKYYQDVKHANIGGSLRWPWIHNRDPVSFH
jgi:hypothetical protein